MSGNKNKTIAFNYFGGKFTYLDEIYRYFPNDITHLGDVFGGSFVVSLNYNKNIIRTANDINDDVVNFFRVLRDQPGELLHNLKLTPVAISEYDNCWERTGNSVEDARRFYVRIRQSFFGLGGQRKNKGFHLAKTKVNAKGGETISRFINGIEGLFEVAEILRKNFQVTNYHYKDFIEKLDFSKILFYCDPPYTKSTRSSSNDYRFDFTDEDHEELARVLHNIKGRAIVSGYSDLDDESDLMNSLYGDWYRVDLPIKRNNIRSSLKKSRGGVINQERIWMNYNPLSINKDLFNNN